MAVAVVPGLLVGIVPTGWNQAPQKRPQVLLQARLELDGADGSGAGHVEDLHDAGAQTRLADNSGDRIGQVVHLAAALRVQRQFALETTIGSRGTTRAACRASKRVVQADSRRLSCRQECLVLGDKREQHELPAPPRLAACLTLNCFIPVMMPF